MKRRFPCAIGLISVAAVLMLSATANGQVTSTEESLSDVYSGKTYSPYAQRSFPTRPLWGDTHLHTTYSMDARLYGNTLGLEEAYRFALGEEVTASTGQRVKLSRPLDWLVIADHSDQMGMAQDIANGAPEVLKSEQGRAWSKGLQAGGQESVEAGLDLVDKFGRGLLDPYLVKTYSPGSPKYSAIWDKTIDAAEAYNDPGRFTALIGYEWTSQVKGANLHRNVIFRDGANKVGQDRAVSDPGADRKHRSDGPVCLARQLRRENGRHRPGHRPQREPVQRDHVPGRSTVHGPQA